MIEPVRGRVVRIRPAYLLAVAVALLLAAVGGLGVGTAQAAGCQSPGRALDLTNWKLQLPLARPGAPTGVVEVKQPELDTFAQAPYFVSCGAGVTFRAPVNGGHTAGSHFARAELREMSGGREAAWSSTSGTHTFTETVAFVVQPEEKPDVVGAQIHNATEDISLLLLRGSNLYVTDGDNPTAKLVTSNYRLGTKIAMKWVVSGGQTKAYVDGALQLTINRAYAGAFFKAGAYPQANCESSSPCGSDNYGSTVITDLRVSHS